MRETKLWTWHLVAGVVIFVLLGLHMVTMHLGGMTHLMVKFGELDAVHPFNSAARDSHLYMTIGYVLLLGAGLYHGLYGLRNILLELTLSPGAEKAVSLLLVALGLGLFGLGTWAALDVHSTLAAAGGA